MAEYDIECRICGKHFVANWYNTLFCPECNRERRKEQKKKLSEYNAKHNRTWKEPTKPKESGKKHTQGFVPAKCPEDCVYIKRIHGDPMCGYLEITDELRGCDPGIGCKRYVGKNEDLKAARHRKTTWDVVNGKKLWQAGWKDSMIAKVMRVSPDAVRSYRRRVWEKEVNDGK